MKRSIFSKSICVLLVLVITALSFSSGVLASPDEGEGESEAKVPSLSSKAICMLDSNTGSIIYAKNENEQMSMASTTKLMTCLIAFEQGDIGREITITRDMLGADGTKLGIREGDRITLYDLCVAALILSGNDAAEAIAIAVAGTKDDFASMMNERASEIGMLNTHFVTPSGLDDEYHYSTAYDMALLAIEVSKNPDITEITSAREMEIYLGNPKQRRVLTTHNYLLTTKKVDGCDGLKTGFTQKSGRCLISHVKKDGVDLVCASLNGVNYFDDHKKLYGYAMKQYESVEIDPSIQNMELALIGGEKRTAALECVGASSFAVQKKYKDSLYKEVQLTRFEYAPVAKGQVVGYVYYKSGDLVLARFPIQVTEDVSSVTEAWISAYVDAIEYKVNGG